MGGKERIEGKGKGNGEGKIGEKGKWERVDFHYFLFLHLTTSNPSWQVKYASNILTECLELAECCIILQCGECGYHSIIKG